MKTLIKTMMAVAALALVTGQVQAKTGYVTIHTIPEGAQLLVNAATLPDGQPFNFGQDFGFPTFVYLANGYSPLTITVPLNSYGLIAETIVVEATPVGPGQRSQRFHINVNQSGPGDCTMSMYNTGLGSNL
jgi:hypothetical protein